MSLTKYMPHFLARQFKTVSTEDYQHVIIPLGHAQRHHSVVEKAEKDAIVSGVDIEKGSPHEKASSSDDDTPRRESVAAYDIHTIEGLRAEVDGDASAFGASSTAYDRKSKVINKAIQDMGMGRYQWELFVLCGFGWFADNFWLQVRILHYPHAFEVSALARSNCPPQGRDFPAIDSSATHRDHVLIAPPA